MPERDATVDVAQELVKLLPTEEGDGHHTQDWVLSPYGYRFITICSGELGPVSAQLYAELSAIDLSAVLYAWLPLGYSTADPLSVQFILLCHTNTDGEGDAFPSWPYIELCRALERSQRPYREITMNVRESMDAEGFRLLMLRLRDSTQRAAAARQRRQSEATSHLRLA